MGYFVSSLRYVSSAKKFHFEVQEKSQLHRAIPYSPTLKMLFHNTKSYLHYATAEASRRPLRIREGFLLDGHFHMRIIYYYIAGIPSVNVGAEIA